MTNIVEPSYSQIEAALRAMYPHLIYPNDLDREKMKAALMAAQKVDPSCYGFMRFGFSCDGVNLQTDSKESMDKIKLWHHHSTATLPYHEKHTIPELRALRARVKELEDANTG